MQKKIALILGGVVLFLFILITSFAWSKVFFDDGESGNISIVNVQMNDSDGSIDTTQTKPMEEATSSIVPYTFKLTNTGFTDSHYQLLLEEDPVSNKVGYRQEDLLKRSQLNYELSLNGSVIKKARLSTIKENVLDERILAGNKVNQYTLKIWVHDEVKEGEWENKYYHYKVKVKSIGE